MKQKQDKRSPYDIPHKDECSDCQGRGYTRDTAPSATAPGSGCPRCLGTGRLAP